MASPPSYCTGTFKALNLRAYIGFSGLHSHRDEIQCTTSILEFQTLVDNTLNNEKKLKFKRIFIFFHFISFHLCFTSPANIDHKYPLLDML